MGFYIDRISMDQPRHQFNLPPHGKADLFLKEIPGTVEIPEPFGWESNLVCVVTNPEFDAALFIPDRRELERARVTPSDRRPRRWLLIPGAADLSGYTEVMAKL